MIQNLISDRATAAASRAATMCDDRSHGEALTSSDVFRCKNHGSQVCRFRVLLQTLAAVRPLACGQIVHHFSCRCSADLQTTARAPLPNIEPLVLVLRYLHTDCTPTCSRHRLPTESLVRAPKLRGLFPCRVTLDIVSHRSGGSVGLFLCLQALLSSFLTRTIELFWSKE